MQDKMIFNCKLNRVNIRGMLVRVAIAAEAHAQEFKHGTMGGGACQIEKGSRSTVDMRSTSQLSGHAIASCKSPMPCHCHPSHHSPNPLCHFMLIFSTGDSVSSVTGEASGLHHRGPTNMGGCSREIRNSLDLIAQTNVEYKKGRSSMQNSMPHVMGKYQELHPEITIICNRQRKWENRGHVY